MKQADGEYPKLAPITEAGSGQGQEKEKAFLRDIIEKLNELFGSTRTDGDQLSFVKAITSKMAESDTLRSQASANSKQQFASSPELAKELLNANIGSLDAFTELSTQVLNSPEKQRRLLSLLLGPAGLYELLRGCRVEMQEKHESIVALVRLPAQRQCNWGLQINKGNSHDG